MNANPPPAKVAAFLQSRLARTPSFSVPGTLRPATLAEGYSIQSAVHDALASHDDRVTGYKVGCATSETRKPFALDEPTYGGILLSTRRDALSSAVDACEGPWAIECEIAMRVSHDVDASAITGSSGLRHRIDALTIACELVQNRYGDAVALGVPTLVADDFFHYRYVLGKWSSPDEIDDPRSLRGRLWIDGGLVDENVASNVMGDPFRSVAWLAGALAKSGRVLRKGDVVLTGAIMPPYWVREAPSRVRLEIDGLGELSAG